MIRQTRENISGNEESNPVILLHLSFQSDVCSVDEIILLRPVLWIWDLSLLHSEESAAESAQYFSIKKNPLNDVWNDLKIHFKS